MPSRSTEKRGRDFIIVDLAAAASPDAQVFCLYDKFCELRDGVNGSYNHLNIELDVRYRTGLRLCGTCTLRLANIGGHWRVGGRGGGRVSFAIIHHSLASRRVAVQALKNSINAHQRFDPWARSGAWAASAERLQPAAITTVLYLSCPSLRSQPPLREDATFRSRGCLATSLKLHPKEWKRCGRPNCPQSGRTP